MKTLLLASVMLISSAIQSAHARPAFQTAEEAAEECKAYGACAKEPAQRPMAAANSAEECRTYGTCSSNELGPSAATQEEINSQGEEEL